MRSTYDLVREHAGGDCLLARQAEVPARPAPTRQARQQPSTAGGPHPTCPRGMNHEQAPLAFRPMPPVALTKPISLYNI